MIRALRRWARRVGLMPYESMVCRSCGYRVPFIRGRKAQAERAWAHFETNHLHAGSTS